MPHVGHVVRMVYSWIVLATIVATVLSGTCSAQSVPGRSSGSEKVPATSLPYLPLIEEMLDQLGEGNVGEFLELFAASHREMDESNLDTNRQQLSRLCALAGRYDGFEIVAIRPVSPRLQTVYCVAHFKYPHVFVFRVRKYLDRWDVISYSFSANLDALDELVDTKVVEDDRPPRAKAEPPVESPEAEEEPEEPKKKEGPAGPTPNQPTSPA